MTTIAAVAVVVACLAAYEWGGRRLPTVRPRWRRACGWAAAALTVTAAGPLGAGADRALWEESLQYALLVFGVAPLVVLGAPLAIGRAARWVGPAGPRWWVGVVAYLAVMVCWRLPGPVDALAALRPLVLVEGVTVVAGSALVWEEIVGMPPWGRRPAPLRMIMAAVGAWSAWLAAFAVGFSSRSWYPSYSRPFAGHLGVMASQELGVAIIFVASAAAFVPVVFSALAEWLGGGANASEPQRLGPQRPTGQYPGDRRPLVRPPWTPRSLDGSHGR